MSEQKIFNPNNAVKMVQNRCKSAQTSAGSVNQPKPVLNIAL